MKTVMQQLLEELNGDSFQELCSNHKYIKDYLESRIKSTYIKKEQIQIQDDFDNGQANYTSPRDYETGKDYYISTFGDSNEAGI